MPPRPKRQRRQVWTPEEDEKLRDLVQEHGAKRWEKIAEYLPNRCGIQCRERWMNNMRPGINKQAFNTEEDELLMELVKKHGSRWSTIGKHFVGRPCSTLKNRYFLLVRHGTAPKPSAWQFQFQTAAATSPPPVETPKKRGRRRSSATTTSSTTATTTTTQAKNRKAATTRRKRRQAWSETSSEEETTNSDDDADDDDHDDDDTQESSTPVSDHSLSTDVNNSNDDQDDGDDGNAEAVQVDGRCNGQGDDDNNGKEVDAIGEQRAESNRHNPTTNQTVTVSFSEFTPLTTNPCATLPPDASPPDGKYPSESVFDKNTKSWSALEIIKAPLSGAKEDNSVENEMVYSSAVTTTAIASAPLTNEDDLDHHSHDVAVQQNADSNALMKVPACTTTTTVVTTKTKITATSVNVTKLATTKSLSPPITLLTSTRGSSSPHENILPNNNTNSGLTSSNKSSPPSYFLTNSNFTISSSSKSSTSPSTPFTTTPRLQTSSSLTTASCIQNTQPLWHFDCEAQDTSARPESSPSMLSITSLLNLNSSDPFNTSMDIKMSDFAKSFTSGWSPQTLLQAPQAQAQAQPTVTHPATFTSPSSLNLESLPSIYDLLPVHGMHQIQPSWQSQQQQQQQQHIQLHTQQSPSLPPQLKLPPPEPTSTSTTTPPLPPPIPSSSTTIITSDVTQNLVGGKFHDASPNNNNTNNNRGSHDSSNNTRAQLAAMLLATTTTLNLRCNTTSPATTHQPLFSSAVAAVVASASSAPAFSPSLMFAAPFPSTTAVAMTSAVYHTPMLAVPRAPPQQTNQLMQQHQQQHKQYRQQHVIASSPPFASPTSYSSINNNTLQYNATHAYYNLQPISPVPNNSTTTMITSTSPMMFQDRATQFQEIEVQKARLNALQQQQQQQQQQQRQRHQNWQQ